jgi:hypothetical protein
MSTIRYIRYQASYIYVAIDIIKVGLMNWKSSLCMMISMISRLIGSQHDPPHRRLLEAVFMASADISENMLVCYHQAAMVLPMQSL